VPLGQNRARPRCTVRARPVCVGLVWPACAAHGLGRHSVRGAGAAQLGQRAQRVAHGASVRDRSARCSVRRRRCTAVARLGGGTTRRADSGTSPAHGRLRGTAARRDGDERVASGVRRRRNRASVASDRGGRDGGASEVSGREAGGLGEASCQVDGGAREAVGRRAAQARRAVGTHGALSRQRL
jgi:hypothetical protein